MNLSNDLITLIFEKLSFNNLLLLLKINNELNNIIKNYKKFVEILKIKASNYIKYRWMDYKINKKENVICKTKNITISNNQNLKLDNLMCIYYKNNSTNIKYNEKCEKYVKKECFILNCISKKKLEKQFICLNYHPYTKIYLRNNYPEYYSSIADNSYNLIVYSDNIYFNKLFN